MSNEYKGMTHLHISAECKNQIWVWSWHNGVICKIKKNGSASVCVCALICSCKNSLVIQCFKLITITLENLHLQISCKLLFYIGYWYAKAQILNRHHLISSCCVRIKTRQRFCKWCKPLVRKPKSWGRTLLRR